MTRGDHETPASTTRADIPGPEDDLERLGYPLPVVEDPDRFFPEPELLTAPEVERIDANHGRLRLPDSDRWERVHPILIDIVEGLAAGRTLDEIAATIPDYPAHNLRRKSQKHKVARKFAWRLHLAGCMRWDLPPTPARFDDRYTVVKELGRGGLGIAHLCIDDETGRDVVIKHPWAVKAPIHKGQRALALEAAILERFPHPSLPVFHATFTDRGLLHLVREYVDGTRVSSLLGRCVEDAPFRNDLFRQIAEAMDHFHRHDLVFFDPSPDNFFLRPDGHITVSDVGGARLVNDQGRVLLRGARGTAGYVASELRGRSPDGVRHATFRSDIYSLGCLYYAMTTGRRPKRLWHHEEIVADLEARGIDGPEATLIDQATRVDPAQRPANMRTLLSMIPDA